MGVYALDSHKKAFTAFIFKAIMERCLFRAIERDGTVELVDERSQELHVKRRSVFFIAFVFLPFFFRPGAVVVAAVCV